MTVNEANSLDLDNLGCNGRKARRGKSRTKKNRLNHKPVGYIRGKRVSGRKYYYYCEAVKQPDGTFKERCEYLGTAQAIHRKMIITFSENGKSYNHPEAKGQSRWCGYLTT